MLYMRVKKQQNPNTQTTKYQQAQDINFVTNIIDFYRNLLSLATSR